MVDTKTEGRWAAEFIMSEANGNRSRENGTVASGQDLAAGEVVMLSTGKLVAFDGGSDVDVIGIIISPADVDADTPAAYIARDAEVNGDLLTYPSGTGDEDVANDGLALLGIIVR